MYEKPTLRLQHYFLFTYFLHESIMNTTVLNYPQSCTVTCNKGLSMCNFVCHRKQNGITTDPQAG